MVTVACPPSCEAGLVADALSALGGRGAEERAGLLTTYLAPPADVESFLALARVHLRERTGRDDLRLTWRWQVHEDWSELWKRGLGVRRVSDRIVVHPTWLDPDVGGGDIVVRLDPGMAFGTAEHGTTRGCLRLLDPLVTPGERVLDLGCGSGILAIAAALLGAGSVLAVDSDPLACDAARENARANRVEDRVVVDEVRVGERWLLENRPFDGVVANLETHLLLPLLSGLCGAIAPGGWMVLSGIGEGERVAVDAALSRDCRPSVVLVAENRDGEWWSGAFRAYESG